MTALLFSGKAPGAATGRTLSLDEVLGSTRRPLVMLMEGTTTNNVRHYTSQGVYR